MPIEVYPYIPFIHMLLLCTYCPYPSVKAFLIITLCIKHKEIFRNDYHSSPHKYYKNSFGFSYFLPYFPFVCFLFAAKSQSPEKRLLKKLIDAYGAPSIRPVHNSSSTVHVLFRMLIAQIIEFVSTNLLF